MATAELLSLYRRNRKHQLATYGNSGLHVWNEARGQFVDAREFVGGGAAYQCHALAAYWSARSSMHFRERFAEDLATHTRRSNAAKKAWKARRATEGGRRGASGGTPLPGSSPVPSATL